MVTTSANEAQESWPKTFYESQRPRTGENEASNWLGKLWDPQEGGLQKRGFIFDQAPITKKANESGSGVGRSRGPETNGSSQQSICKCYTKKQLTKTSANKSSKSLKC